MPTTPACPSHPLPPPPSLAAGTAPARLATWAWLGSWPATPATFRGPWAPWRVSVGGPACGRRCASLCGCGWECAASCICGAAQDPVCVCLRVQGARPSCSWASTAPPRPTFFRLEFSCVSLLIGVCISLHPRPCPPPTRRHHPARSLLRRGDCHRGAAGPWAAEGAAVSAPFLWDPCLHWMALPWRCGGSSAVRAPMPARAGSACRASPCCPARCPVLPPSPPRLPLCLVLPLQGPR